jgi:excinuclease ABC subunit C
MKNNENIISQIPNKPGVYQFKDKNGNVLYIGKAKDLRKRIKSYFQQTNKQSIRIQKMVEQIDDIEVTVVNSELEAIILETNLIKEIRPKYNILMKDDKNYVYVKITKNEDFPQIKIVRKVENDGALYFGPKTAAGKVRKTLDVLKKIFPYRHCNLFLKYEKTGKVTVVNKTMKYPCLDYHIKRCIGPCVCNCTKQEYEEIIKQIVRFLRGHTDEIIESLSLQMQQAAADKQFEKAAKLRDKLQAITEISEKQVVSTPNREDIDAINFVSETGRIFFTLFMIRDGKFINQENFEFKSGVDKEDIKDYEEILESFITQYYEKCTDFPKEILIPNKIPGIETLEKWISEIKGSKIKILIPQKGEKEKIIKLAEKNAKNFANLSRIKWQNNEQKRKKALEELKEKLNLPKIPRRIECFDISHISGTNQVASMVVFKNGTPSTKDYRRFKIRTLKEGKPDDFAAMLEVLKRRFLYLVKSKSDIKFKKTKDILTGSLNKKIISTCKHQVIKDFDYYFDFKIQKNFTDFFMGIIQRAKKNRIYIAAEKSVLEEAEKSGFVKVKKSPDEIKISKQKTCLMFDKSKYKQEKGFAEKPDLILIDGGKGQLTQGVKIQKKFKTDIKLVALAKKNEDVYIPGSNLPLPFAKDSEALYLLQQLRDEAHRFAITYHKNLRSKEMFK